MEEPSIAYQKTGGCAMLNLPFSGHFPIFLRIKNGKSLVV